MDNKKIAEAWAEQDPEFRFAMGSNYQFNGPNLYSYAELIGKINAKRGIAVITTRKFSQTTTRHTNMAVRAAEKRGWAVQRRDPNTAWPEGVDG